MVPVRDDLPADTFAGDRILTYRQLISEWLPKAARTTCPGYWREEQ